MSNWTKNLTLITLLSLSTIGIATTSAAIASTTMQNATLQAETSLTPRHKGDKYLLSQRCEYWEVTASDVNVRDNNSKTARVIDVLPKGTVVELHGWSQDGEWADISTQQYQGWVWADYLKCYQH
ncbi:MAG: SH3 domain-containing protein [Aphanothece sp. CMT-3BRIN-NPC111]|jgi:uncharacterized protein YgiM (DUF1202 family)|nr:SH3 domain-containing protein [Aphanothece sp. CMT-3BRIN-NPC111]